uniref:Large ribosomal subunit protein uL2c n=1 Tax=Pseudobryopsis hainanensis TaxID=2320808 RepID=A0A3S5X2G8_9CHLO|nr:ribosomal protein L2 [Pseudobryopsis hainanensis]
MSIKPGCKFFSTNKIMKPLRNQTRFLQRSQGRNHRGVITSRHRGGGHKRLYRRIDLMRHKIGVIAQVKNIEYDPNRSARVVRLHYADGTKHYILYPNNLALGTKIIAHPTAPILIGNSLPLKNIPLGTQVHNVELIPGSGGQIARSAGSSAQILAKEQNRVTLRLPSGEVRWVSEYCWATVGKVSENPQINEHRRKAGQSRWRGQRPRVRGVAMNAADHPHGGGEGRAPIGRPCPVTPWGRSALGARTRRKKSSSAFILRKRK